MDIRPALAMARPTSPRGSFLTSLKRATHVAHPFDYWLLDDILPPALIEDLAALPFPAPSAPVFDGRRESNNATRAYFSPLIQARHPACKATAQLFNDLGVIGALAAATGARLEDGQLRIEYCQDADGFWLEPHCDIKVKRLTLLIYLSPEPELADAGTDVYDGDPAHRRVATAPYGPNKGLIFVPGDNTWHGFSQRPIRALRKSIIVNYVAPSWQNRQELAFP